MNDLVHGKPRAKLRLKRDISREQKLVRSAEIELRIAEIRQAPRAQQMDQLQSEIEESNRLHERFAELWKRTYGLGFAPIGADAVEWERLQSDICRHDDTLAFRAYALGVEITDTESPQKPVLQ